VISNSPRAAGRRVNVFMDATTYIDVYIDITSRIKYFPKIKKITVACDPPKWSSDVIFQLDTENGQRLENPMCSEGSGSFMRTWKYASTEYLRLKKESDSIFFDSRESHLPAKENSVLPCFLDQLSERMKMACRVTFTSLLSSTLSTLKL
jgi:hypothetical protein